MQRPHNNNVFTKIMNKMNHFGDESSLHGIGHVLTLSQIPGYRRLFWLSILTICGFGTFTILSSALGLYTQSSVSYSVDTNYLSFNTPFPAVTLCEQVESDRLKNFIIAKQFPLTMTTFFREVFSYNVKYCRSCISCKMNSTCLENFLDLVEDFRLKCEEMLTDCWWGEQPFKCCERFHPIQTEYGICYVFNSRLANNESLLYVNRQVGLRRLLFTTIRSVAIRVHSPDEQISAKVKNILKPNSLPLVSELNATVKAEATTSDVTIHSLGLDRRDCLLEHERPAFAQLWPFKRYSYSACVLYCRAMMQVDACNCTYHFMVKLNGIDICDIQGLACLYRNKDALQVNYDCGCLDACEEVYYEAVYVSYTRDVEPSSELLGRGSRGLVQLNGLPTLRVRRHAFRDIFSFVGITWFILLILPTSTGNMLDIGGVGGVFFGASLLSVIEIVYLLCIRRG